MDTVWGMMLMSWAPWLLLGAGGLYVGLRHARALERRNSSNPEISTYKTGLRNSKTRWRRPLETFPESTTASSLPPN